MTTNKITDTFTRADSATTLGTADTGETWSALAGTWGIGTNAARCVSANNDDVAVVDLGGTDMTVSAVISLGAGDDNPGMIARCSDVNNFYLVTMNVGGAMAFFKKVAGSFTQLGVSLPAGSVASGDTVSLTVRGGSINVRVNGTTKYTLTDSSLATGTKAGFRYGDAGTGTCVSRWDNFSLTGEDPQSFGIHLESATVVASYKNGSLFARYGHPSQSGGLVCISTGAPTNSVLPFVSRIEVRDAPGGTLLMSDDFANVASWSQYANPVTPLWEILPSGYGHCRNTDAMLYQTQPGGSAYVELQGVSFDHDDEQGWIMAILSRTTAGNGTVADGYRVLLRPNGGVEVPSGTGLGWTVGSIVF